MSNDEESRNDQRADRVRLVSDCYLTPSMGHKAAHRLHVDKAITR